MNSKQLTKEKKILSYLYDISVELADNKNYEDEIYPKMDKVIKYIKKLNDRLDKYGL